MSNLHHFATCPHCAKSNGKGNVCLDFDSLDKELQRSFNGTDMTFPPGRDIATQPKLLRFEHEGELWVPCEHAIAVFCAAISDREPLYFEYRSRHWDEHDPHGSGWSHFGTYSHTSAEFVFAGENCTGFNSAGELEIPTEFSGTYSKLLAHFWAVFAEDVRSFVIGVKDVARTTKLIRLNRSRK